MGGGPGWALGVRQADPDPDPLPDPQGPSLAQGDPSWALRSLLGTQEGALVGTYVFCGKIKSQCTH